MSQYDQAQLAKLVLMVSDFVAGVDRSIAFANRIESQMYAAFADDYDSDATNDFMIALASYRPGGGQGLYSERDLLEASEAVLPKLKSLLRSSS